MHVLKPGKDGPSSTERLLHLIRSSSSAPRTIGNADSTSAPLRVKKSLSDRFRQLLSSFGPTQHVGVEISRQGLRLAKVDPRENPPRLLDLRQVGYNPLAPPGSPEFIHFLRSILLDFCGSDAGRIRIWTLIPSLEANLKHLVIPMVGEKEQAKAVTWTLAREGGFDEAHTAFDFQVAGQVMDRGIAKLSVNVALAPAVRIREITSLFRKAGFEPAGITVAPVALRNIFVSKWTSPYFDTFAHLFVGNDWSRVDIFKKDHISLTRSFRTGLQSIAQGLMEGYNTLEEPVAAVQKRMEPLRRRERDAEHEFPREQNRDKLYERDEIHPFGFLGREAAGELLLTKLNEEPASDFPSQQETGKKPECSLPAPAKPGSELQPDDVLFLAQAALERLVRQVERTFSHHTFVIKKAAVEKLFISGPLASSTPLRAWLSKRLGIDVLQLDPLNPATAPAAAVPLPQTARDRDAFLPALGLAFSDSRKTLNFLFTFRDKAKARLLRRIDLAVLSVFGLLLLLVIGLFFWQGRQFDSRQQSLQSLQSALQASAPKLDERFLLEFSGTVLRQQQMLMPEGPRFAALAALGAVTQETTPEVKLLSATMRSVIEPALTGSPEVRQRILVEGVVQSDQPRQEPLLNAYLDRLRSTGLFANVALDKGELVGADTASPVFHFVIAAELH